MNRKKVEEAIEEAERFLDRARAVLNNEPHYWFCGSADTGALRRSSMDLTRSLANLRKSG